MPTDKSKQLKGTCFVTMGFGHKTDFMTGRTLDLDKTYEKIIKPAVEVAGLTCIRADEIVHSGRLEVPTFENLMTADLVIADISTSNPNVFYDLGLRHALRPYSTIVIAEDGSKFFPFDLNSVQILQYHHMGDDIGFQEAMRVRQLLTAHIIASMTASPRDTDSPVYAFIPNLNPPSKGPEQGQANVTAPGSSGGSVVSAESAGLGLGWEQADKAQRAGDFLTARNLLSAIRELKKTTDPNEPEDPRLIQRLALVTYKSRHPTTRKALEDASALLASLNPATSNDPETVALWGAVNQQLWNETRDPAFLDNAVQGYERAFFFSSDYLQGINLAFLLNLRSVERATERAEAIADFVQGKRIRHEVISICEKLLMTGELLEDARYWALAALAEAYLGIGEELKSNQTMEQAEALKPATWMLSTTSEQLDKLRALLKDSPPK